MKLRIRIYKKTISKLTNTSLALFVITFIVIFNSASYAQGFLHTEGKKIVDGNGQNILLRGIGTGNWMLQEGYMMQTSGIAGTQHEFRNKLIQTIGLEKTNDFYESWLLNHFQKIDVDSMAAWGFNSIRVALHYKWFTLPIEEEPIQGENTWLSKGFALTDSLLSWCSKNQMYLILDLHGAPGGQGKNADISDYDDSKPSLWESNYNKDKTVALWRKFAERYKNEPWIGGYDLINETNWSFPEGNNSQLKALFVRITNAIREVDQNHIIFIEGNGFANDFSGLTPPWDNNMVYSFHKYWSYNDENSLDWVIQLRDNYNVPLWLGESGENSNTWFTNLVNLAERNNIGWSWWPVKKSGINNILKVETNQDYKNLINSWNGQGFIAADDAFQAVMKFSDNHRFENCTIQYDVIDALIRQPHTKSTKAFKPHTTNQKIFAVDYDLGRNNFAYYDTDTANYHLNTNTFAEWNIGWAYRNDGVDIQNCSDLESNGFNVGWTKAGEWLLYTLNSEAEGAYKLQLRYASEKINSIHLEVNGKIASKSIVIPSTGSWENWQSFVIEDIILPLGEAKVKIVFETDGLNLNYFRFFEPKAISEIPFLLIAGNTHKYNNDVYLNFNKPITTPASEFKISDFTLIVNNASFPVSKLILAGSNNNQLILTAGKDLFYTSNIRVSYKGTSIYNSEQLLTEFVAQKVSNFIYPHFEIPGKIEAEDFFFNKGFQLENCTDNNGGINTAYANDGDYLDYLINVSKTGVYAIDFRVALNSGNAEILLMNSFEDRIIANKSVKFTSTGGWQTWQTQSSTVNLAGGKLVFRIYSRNGQHNLNWFSLDFLTNSSEPISPEEYIRIYPNPASTYFNLEFLNSQEKIITLYNLYGQKLVSFSTENKHASIDISKYPVGHYLLNCMENNKNKSFKIQIAR